MSMGEAEELERLAALHRDGQLTDQEFSTAKSRLLSPDKPSSSELPAQRPKSRRGLVIAGVVLMVAAVTGAVVLALQRDGERTEAADGTPTPTPIAPQSAETTAAPVVPTSTLRLPNPYAGWVAKQSDGRAQFTVVTIGAMAQSLRQAIINSGSVDCQDHLASTNDLLADSQMSGLDAPPQWLKFVNLYKAALEQCVAGRFEEAADTFLDVRANYSATYTLFED